jgi:flagella basal body P-ring formation protein FlgA
MRLLRILCLCLPLLAGAARLSGAATPEPVEALPAADGPGLKLPAVERLQAAALAYVEAQATNLSGNYTFRVTRPPVLPRVADGVTSDRLSFEPSHLSRLGGPLGGNFFASFRVSLDGRPLGLVRVDLEGKWTGKLLRTVTAIARKSVPEPGQYEQIPFEGTPPAGALMELPAGFWLRAPVGIGHILVTQDLEAIPVVLAGEEVRLELESGDLTIAVAALARTSGAVGAKIRVEVPGSHRNMQAVVTGPDEVRVQYAGGN